MLRKTLNSVIPTTLTSPHTPAISPCIFGSSIPFVSKPKDVHIRFFLFAYRQLLQMLWSVLFKEEVSFKDFLVEMSEIASHRLERGEEKKRSGTAH